MKLRKLLSGLLCLMLVVSLSVPVFAADVPYSFSLTNTGTRYVKAVTEPNQKVLPNDPGTIKSTGTNAPGWGFYMRLKNYDFYNMETYSYWYNNSNMVRHPAYVDQAHSDQKDYFIEGRIDNDYYGTYYISGAFNADYT